MAIGKKVINWFSHAGRDMPWRETRDPYRIWISEVIFQQTRIQQGEAYYHRFVERFPDVHTLAKAEQDEVLKYWEGLGYYSRARNLHAAAKQLVDNYGGKFPKDFQILLNLKGVGPYTARAIGSFAFDNEVGVLDGNVLRVISRVLGDPAPINEQKTRKRLQTEIDSWVPPGQSRAFNHGMMDLGSTICTPTRPACLLCPLEHDCVARKNGLTEILPFKSKKLKRKQRYYFFYLTDMESGQIAIRQRPVSGFWGGLWEIPNEEMTLNQWKEGSLLPGGEFQVEMKHVFTHFDMMIKVYRIPALKPELEEEVKFITQDKISIFAFARAVLKIFEQTGLKSID